MPADERTISERVAVLEERVKEVQADIDRLDIVIQGPPRQESIRGRLHSLEAADAATKAANAAIDAARLVQEQSAEKRFSRSEKLAGLLLAAIVSASALMNIVIALHK